MPSFEDIQRYYQSTGTIGQQLKVMSDMVVQSTWENDLQTRLCYIYDYYHDDQPEELSGYNPSLSKTKIPVKLKFIVKEYKSASKDDPEYHIQFEPNVWNSMSCKPDWFDETYSRVGIKYPLSLYVDIPDDRGVYQKWLIFYKEEGNQFIKCGVMRCNYLFQWIKDDGVHRYKRQMWGVDRSQSSYTSCGTEKYNTARCNRKLCSAFLRICWNALRAITLKQKDEISLDGIVKIVIDWVISREVLNRNTLNDYQLKYC